MKTNTIYEHILLAQTKVVEKINTHFMLENFFIAVFLLWNNVEKYFGAGQVSDDNMA